ncbi:esterase-like activity of phytase family protein [Limnofasciculus baicalensis]
MMQAKHLISWLGCSFAISVVNIIANSQAATALSFANTLSIPADTTDLSPLNGGSGGANVNRFGFFSDIYYDHYQNVYYGLSDRGPGGGVISYNTRVQKFSLDVDSNTGAIANFNVLETILFTKNGQYFNGLNPQLLNGDKGILGLSFDPEGFAIAPNGNFYVSDEYGPSVYEFSPTGSFIRAFQTPDNILSKVGSTPNYVDGRGTITTGRQDNRGFEGLTLTPDGKKLLVMLQDPLVNEGSSNDGRRSNNLRIVEFDTATGTSTAQYIYGLESIADINSRIPGTANDFGATSQGRNIGISAITAINENEFLVLERDNRGVGVDDPTGSNPVGSKRVYKINLTGATNVSGISLAGTNTLPTGVTAVSKTLFADIASFLKGNGQIIPEKFEGLAIGPKLSDGSYAIILGTDNDYSVTQSGSGTQFDVCTDGTTSTQVPIDSGCPTGQKLLPGYLYSLKASSTEIGRFVPAEKVPEPGTLGGLALIVLSGFLPKRKKND